eukprot:COSAG01_NODE_8691_length_2695_cov_8.342450_1_plen_721_part_10
MAPASVQCVPVFLDRRKGVAHYLGTAVMAANIAGNGAIAVGARDPSVASDVDDQVETSRLAAWLRARGLEQHLRDIIAFFAAVEYPPEEYLPTVESFSDGELHAFVHEAILDAWLYVRGLDQFQPAVVHSCTEAGHSPGEWVRILSALDGVELQGFIRAARRAYRMDGRGLDGGQPRRNSLKSQLLGSGGTVSSSVSVRVAEGAETPSSSSAAVVETSSSAAMGSRRKRPPLEQRADVDQPAALSHGAANKLGCDMVTFSHSGPLGISWCKLLPSGPTPATTGDLVPVVKAVKAGSVAAQQGVAPTQVLRSINGMEVRSWDWRSLITCLKTQRPLTLSFFSAKDGRSLDKNRHRLSVRVLFANAGPMGLSLRPAATREEGVSAATLQAVKPTSPVYNDRRLQAGMRVAGLQVGLGPVVSCADWAYDRVVLELRQAKRPLTVTFAAMVGAAAPSGNSDGRPESTAPSVPLLTSPVSTVDGNLPIGVAATAIVRQQRRDELEVLQTKPTVDRRAGSQRTILSLVEQEEALIADSACNFLLQYKARKSAKGTAGNEAKSVAAHSTKISKAESESKDVHLGPNAATYKLACSGTMASQVPKLAIAKPTREANAHAGTPQMAACESVADSSDAPQHAETVVANALMKPSANPEASISQQASQSNKNGISVTFTDPGALGMRLAPNRHTGRTEVVGINAGTQAEQHPGLRVGLALAAVGGESVSGRS